MPKKTTRSTRKQAPSRQTQVTKSPRRPKPSRTGTHPIHPPLKANGKAFAEHLAIVAPRTIWLAMVREPKALQMMEDNGRLTPEFVALMREAEGWPREVQRWVKTNCVGNTTLFKALRGQLEHTLYHAQAGPGDPERDQWCAAPGHLEGRNEPMDSGVDATQWPCCSPYCKPP